MDWLLRKPGRAANGCERFHRGSEQMRYATSKDFQELFTDGADGLYLLSFLLTADAEKAEKCFVSGFEDCAGANAVFIEWARSWARRIVIRNAIRETAGPEDPADQFAQIALAGNNRHGSLLSEQLRPFASILGLRRLERFVFVLSVLERYSDAECSRFLKVPPADVRQAREQAFAHMTESNQRQDRLDSKVTAPALRLKAAGGPA